MLVLIPATIATTAIALSLAILSALVHAISLAVAKTIDSCCGSSQDEKQFGDSSNDEYFVIQ